MLESTTKVESLICRQCSDFITSFLNGSKAPSEVLHRERFNEESDYAISHCITQHRKMGAGISNVFKKKFGGLNDLRCQQLKVGQICFCRIYLVYNFLIHERTVISKRRTTKKVWTESTEWKSHLEVIFQDTVKEVLV